MGFCYFLDPYSILEKDDSSIVDDVMQRLLDKQVLGADVLDDLGLDYKDSNWKDPRTKMKLRHQQVDLSLKNIICSPAEIDSVKHFSLITCFK